MLRIRIHDLVAAGQDQEGITNSDLALSRRKGGGEPMGRTYTLSSHEFPTKNMASFPT